MQKSPSKNLPESDQPKLQGRNILGQRLRPRRLRKHERLALINTVEHAMSDEHYCEVRVYWTDSGVWVAPVRIEGRTRLSQ